MTSVVDSSVTEWSYPRQKHLTCELDLSWKRANRKRDATSILARFCPTAAGLALVNLCTFNIAAGDKSPADSQIVLAWQKQTSIPDKEGFAGIYAGVSGGSLLVAGGANFPDKRPWEGGAKKWSGKVFVLDRPKGKWKIAGQLPRPLGYGVSATTLEGVVCIGGSDSEKHYGDVFLLKWTGKDVKIRTLPGLPLPCANLSGAVLNETIYVAGGIAEPHSTAALRTFWSLDLRNLAAGWREMEPWPGSERMFAVAAVDGQSFFLFSGAALKRDKDDKPIREWLRDAYRYTPGLGWRKLPDLPRPTVAAPSPAPSLNGCLWIWGGDDGSQINTQPAAHKGFSRDVFAFDLTRGEWHGYERLPFGLVTTPVVTWNDLLVVPGGEVHPGIRSTEVWGFRTN